MSLLKLKNISPSIKKADITKNIITEITNPINSPYIRLDSLIICINLMTYSTINTAKIKAASIEKVITSALSLPIKSGFKRNDNINNKPTKAIIPYLTSKAKCEHSKNDDL